MAGVVLFALYSYTLAQYALAAETNCSRIFHSAVVGNGNLYIDGGEMHTRWPNDTITTKPIDDLETIDLTKSWVNSDTDLYTYIPKPLANNTAIYLDEGAAWSDGDNLFFMVTSLSDAMVISVAIMRWMASIIINIVTETLNNHIIQREHSDWQGYRQSSERAQKGRLVQSITSASRRLQQLYFVYLFVHMMVAGIC
ncbi:hypothetical protein BDV41DRAFT_580683 [Aspergillus transmontanensis]|uniref:Uncharacterized protein n=1 Tax=Aspergillus transmontanensis TaxID=1034304 RepID=A0A5N6VLE9_9EURO|nr:hypothetical protein BDV41DRAFT_580683 [Aspergillus transmontanensis]